MKITSVECYLGTGAIGGFVTMKINTDSGIYGWGEAGLAYGKSAEAAFGQCQDFGKLILGMDPFNTEEIWEHLHRHTFWGMGGGVVITSAMAAIDIACWDIKGKALGVPVYKLLGGKVEALEFTAKNDGYGILHTPLMKLPLRHGVLLAAIVREGRIIIPGGMTTIEPGDHVLVVTNVMGLTDLKHILA